MIGAGGKLNETLGPFAGPQNSQFVKVFSYHFESNGKGGGNGLMPGSNHHSVKKLDLAQGRSRMGQDMPISLTQSTQIAPPVSWLGQGYWGF
jgi:hypothetical protein